MFQSQRLERLCRNNQTFRPMALQNTCQDSHNEIRRTNTTEIVANSFEPAPFNVELVVLEVIGG